LLRNVIGCWKEVIGVRELLKHLLQVGCQHVLLAKLLHSGKVVNFLVVLHSRNLLRTHRKIRSIYVSIVPSVIIVLQFEAKQLFANKMDHRVLAVLRIRRYILLEIFITICL